MIPSIDDRLDSMARALREVVLPALSADRSLAIEQTHLVLAHMGMIREQGDRALAFERYEVETMIQLAKDLLEIASGGPDTEQSAAELRELLYAATLDNPAARRSALFNIGIGVERLIEASLEDGSAAFRTSSFDCVVLFGRLMSANDRVWNRAAGFESAEAELPALRVSVAPETA